MNKQNKILQVHVFTEGLKNNTYALPSLQAFAKGIGATGDKVKLINKKKYDPCDVAVIFGDVREGKGKDKRMRFKAEVKGRHIRRGLVVIDTAILTRSSSVGSIYRRIGIDGILRNEINAPNENAPQDRWEKISLHANLEIGSWRENGTHITIALQRPLDASLKSSERLRPEKYMSWIIKTISQLQHKTDLPIHIRSHPDSLQQEDEQKWLQSVKNKISDDVIWDTSPVPFKTAMENCALCVTYNSGASVDAALLGVPVMACDPGSFAWDISIHNTENWNPNISYTPARQQWLNNLSYMEWSIEEMEEGLPWQHLRQELSKQLF